MLRRLVSFVRLPPVERRLGLRAIATLAAVRLTMRIVAFPRLRSAVERWSRGAAPRPADPNQARAVRRAVERAVRTLPGSACLAQALAAEILLRRAGQPVRVSIGVAANSASALNSLDAHAWARSAGVMVAGDRADLATYRTLAVFDTDPPEGT
jgi:hypothetical protein